MELELITNYGVEWRNGVIFPAATGLYPHDNIRTPLETHQFPGIIFFFWNKADEGQN
jgi:hypothetical protein